MHRAACRRFWPLVAVGRRWGSSTAASAAASATRAATTPAPAGAFACTVRRGGFMTELSMPNASHVAAAAAAPEYQTALRLTSGGRCIHLTGPSNTGKRTLALAIADAASARGRRAMVTSTSAARAAQMGRGGMHLPTFLGLRSLLHETSVEQLVATLHRHIRLTRDAYASAVATLRDVDVLVLDSLEGFTSINVLRAMDIVAREVREQPNLPMGGIQLIVTSNFWRTIGVDQSSPHGGYIFQGDFFSGLFPPARTVLMHRFVHRDQSRAPSADLDQITVDALFNCLDAAAAEDALNSPAPCLTLPHTRCSVQSPSPPTTPVERANAVLTCELRDNVNTTIDSYARIARQMARSQAPTHYLLRNSRFGSWLGRSLTALVFPNVWNLQRRMGLVTRSAVMLTHDLIGPRGQVLLPAGTLGTVVSTHDHWVRIETWHKGESFNVPPLQVVARHSRYPSVTARLAQFPLAPARFVSPAEMIRTNVAPEMIHFDPRYLTEPNELGNTLAVVRNPDGLRVTPKGALGALLEREGNVHEATRVYYESLLSAADLGGFFGNRPSYLAPAGASRVCRNCKQHVAAGEFHAHWLQCTASQRWCSDCNVTVPLAKWEAHNEKHTVVMCLDCGRALEWRNWRLHRNTCGAMLREVSPDNEFLPAVTQEAVLQAGIDRRDLHTVKQISKSNLPKSRSQVARDHRTRFVYQAPQGW